MSSSKMSQPPKTRFVERGERHEVLDLRRAIVGALAEANRAHLRQAAERLPETGLHGFDAGDERGGDGSHAREEGRRAFRTQEEYSWPSRTSSVGDRGLPQESGTKRTSPCPIRPSNVRVRRMSEQNVNESTQADVPAGVSAASGAGGADRLAGLIIGTAAVLLGIATLRPAAIDAPESCAAGSRIAQADRAHRRARRAADALHLDARR